MMPYGVNVGWPIWVPDVGAAWVSYGAYVGLPIWVPCVTHCYSHVGPIWKRWGAMWAPYGNHVGMFAGI